MSKRTETQILPDSWQTQSHSQDGRIRDGREWNRVSQSFIYLALLEHLHDATQIAPLSPAKNTSESSHHDDPVDRRREPQREFRRGSRGKHALLRPCEALGLISVSK